MEKKSSGLLGQDVLYIKNQNNMWWLRVTDGQLWGRKSIDRGHSWNQWITLVEDYHGFFSFTLGGESMLHMSCKGSGGALVYICWQEDEILADTLAEEWLDQGRIIYQSILVDGEGAVSIIYFTDNPIEHLWQIKHAPRENDRWDLPTIVDQGVGPGQNQGACAVDQQGKIHLVYQTYQDNKYQLAYRDRDKSTRSWSEKAVITDADRSNLYPCAVVDQQGTFHLTWIRSDGMNYRVMYRRKTRGGWMVGGWQKEMFLSQAEVNSYNPIIGITQEEVLVLWQQLDGIFKCVSYDQGKSFKDPVLQEKFEKLNYKNLLSIDSYKNKGLTTMETFNTGSTAIALLATIYEQQLDEEMEPIVALTQLQEGNSLSLTNGEYLAQDYGQKGLAQYLKKIDGNFQKLVFETEDVRLTNLQMKETMVEQAAKITAANQELEEANSNLSSAKANAQALQKVLDSLKQAVSRGEREKKALAEEKIKLEKKLRQQEGKISALQNQQETLHQQLELQEKENSKHLKELVKELDLKVKRIRELEDTIEQMNNAPLWQKLLRKN